MLQKIELKYDPLDPETLLNPYPIYKKLRENAPVYWHEGMKSWVLTRYDDCKEVLRNHEVFTTDRRRVGVEIPDVRHTVQSLDPPDNIPLRNLLTRAFNSQDINNVREKIHVLIKDIFKKHKSINEFDFMREVSAPLALSMTAITLGVDEPNLDSFLEISEAITRQMDSGLRPENIEPGNQAREKLNTLVGEWFAAEDRPGIVSYIRKHAQNTNVPEHYIRNTTGTMFNASFGSLYAVFGNVVLALLEHPEVFDKLNDKSLIDTGVDELIRFDGPAQGTGRIAAKTTKIRDTTIQKGDVIVVLFAAANRDPEVFPEPDSIILDRSKNPHLGFGWGPHTCVGTFFGKLAIKELILCLLEESSRLRLLRRPTRRVTATSRGIELLPVSFS
ncbi:cytochrome P450 [Bacillus arachidis]|uniref:cytochrome P450 n=1 Tax=Bacillus arachidis TaxID=2819290 RepID=UPI00255D0F64|nr:cytochrome P450 [Bacillus arachidis]WIY58953.1 cytochrome P450 [Bacillus arachidis]